MKVLQKSLAIFVSWFLLLAAFVNSASARQNDQISQQAPPPAAKQSPAELQQLVAPIALYPDELVAQILAAATYPTEIVEADRWLQEHPNLKGTDLGKEVDQQNWDPSVKALTPFPSVLANLDKNLSWTSSLGEAYVGQPQDVMDAVQSMRKRANDAGNLRSNDQEKVGTQGQTIVVEPANPDVVYVPAYDPWLVYGAPVAMWPGWFGYPGLYLAGPGIVFGVGFGIGFFGGFGWGWHHWGFDWHNHDVMFNHNAYFSHSRTFAGRNAFHGGADFNRGGFRGNERNPATNRGFASHAQSGMHSGAFSGLDHGGVAHGNSFRGSSSFGGAHAGGFHGGGGHR